MHPIIEILVLVVWLFFSFQTSRQYFWNLAHDIQHQDIYKVKVTISTTILFVLPIFIGTLIKDVF